MADLKKIDQYLASRGYDPNARLADYRDPNAYQAPKAAPPKSDFAGNVAKSVGAVPGALLRGVGDVLGGTSFAKIPQIIGAYGSLGRQKETLARRDVMFAKASKEFKSGKISAKEYAKRLNDAIGATSIDEERKKTEGALKDASRYGEQFVNNATVLGAVAGGIAGAAGRTGVNAASKAALGEAYSGGVKAFGKGVLAETTGLAKPFMGGAGKGGVVKALTGTLGGTLEGQANAAMVRDFSKGKVDPLNTALTVGMAMPGGPLGAAGAALKGTGKLVNKAIYDTHGLYDVVTLKGGKTVNQIMAEVAQTNPKVAKSLEKVLKVGQDLTIQEHGSNLKIAATALEKNQPSGKKFADMTIDEFVKALGGNISDRKKGQNVLKAAEKAGLVVPEGKGAVMARITNKAKAGLVKRLTENDPVEEMAKIAKEGIEVEGKKLKNANLIGQLQDIVNSGRKGDDLARAINKQIAATEAVVSGGKVFTTKDGRFLALASNPGVVKRPGEVADIVKGKKAVFGVIGRTLEKAGISTKGTDPTEQKAIFNSVKNSFVTAVGKDDSIEMSGKDILSKLNQLTDKKTGVFDIRQLSKKEIADALGTDKAGAARIMSHYNDAFKELSFSQRGLAGKLTDWNMRNNPVAPGYARIQSTARYEKNPFFRLQENTETAIGSSLQNGKLPVLPRTTKYNKTVKVLEESGFFQRELAGPAGEGAAGLGAISAKLSPFQKSTFARDIENLAGKDKTDILKFINNPKNADLIQEMKTIAQYPDRGFTSSNFMKALNLAVFPMRYNLKVTQFAAKQLARQSGATQMAVIKGLKDFSDWQKTPEGIKWNSDNSEALGILRYFTPIGSVESALRLLSPGEVRGIKDLGQIGGLPFGVISRVLQGQGITQSARPYLNPKTGEVVPDKIPADVKSRARQALADIIDTMFTFPGRLVDAPVSKKRLSEGAADWATMGLLKGGEYETKTRTDLTPQQRKQQAVLQAGQKKTTLSSPTTMKNRPANLSSNKPVSITPIYKTNSKGKRVKAKASAPGTWRP